MKVHTMFKKYRCLINQEGLILDQLQELEAVTCLKDLPKIGCLNGVTGKGNHERELDRDCQRIRPGMDTA